LIIEAADHLHVGAGIQSVHRSVGFGRSQTVEHELHHGGVIADDKAVEFPFVTQDFF
jgi:hypothetical protein